MKALNDIPNKSYMIKEVTHVDLGPIWYHSEPSEVPYSPNQYLDRDFFATFYSKATVAPLRDYSVFFVGLFVGI